MVTLQQMYDKLVTIPSAVTNESGAVSADVLNGKEFWGLTSSGWGPRTGTMPNQGAGPTITPTSVVQTVSAGYYATDITVQGDADLQAVNIAEGVELFGVTGSFSGGVGLYKSGQTTSYRTGDDGDIEAGRPWPNPRFTDHGNTVTDNLTGLMWVKAPKTLDGNNDSQVWNNAIDFCVNLSYDGYDDWRLPNVRELQSLVDYGRFNLSLPTGHPFIDIDFTQWTSSTIDGIANLARTVLFNNGSVSYEDKSSGSPWVWPVRGGE